MNATSVALQLPEGLTMYASTIGDILIKFAYRFQPSPSSTVDDNNNNKKPTGIKSLSILGDVTYGACCIDDLSARALGCDLLVHYGHSCLVPLTCTVIPCLYVFVEIRVDVQHLVDCVKLTFRQEEEKRQGQLLLPQGCSGEVVGGEDCQSLRPSSRIIETLVMGTVQFRSAVIESAERLHEDSSTFASSSSPGCDIHFQAIVPQAKPLSPGEVLGCTAPAGLATIDFEEALSSTRQRQARRNKEYSAEAITNAADAVQSSTSSSSSSSSKNNNNNILARERVMIFIADGRFHLEAAMISNPTLRALRYDPYSKTLTEEKYDMIHMKKLRREAILSVRRIWGMSPHPRNNVATDFFTHTMDVVRGRVVGNSVPHDTDIIANSVLHHRPSLHHPFSKMTLSSSDDIASNGTTKLFGIILGTLGRQGNPAILSRIRSLLHGRGIRSVTILLSEIFPKKLEMMSNTTTKSLGGGREGGGGGVCAWVQIACPRLSIDWGHYFCVPVLSSYELFVAMGEVVDSSLWKAEEDEAREENIVGGIDGRVGQDNGYPMDFYSKSGGPWANYYESNSDRKVLSYGN